MVDGRVDNNPIEVEQERFDRHNASGWQTTKVVDSGTDWWFEKNLRQKLRNQFAFNLLCLTKYF
ncbi:hypothetical protein GCM10028810_09530 [Spirosoma litoris]